VKPVGRRTHEPEHADRPRPDLQRRQHTAVQPEGEQLLLLGIARRLHRPPVDELAVEHLLQYRSFDGPRGAARKHPIGAAAGDRHHLCASALDEHDRDAVEGDESAQLANERAERLVEVERRRERPRAPVRGLQQVDAAAELVAEALRLGRPRLGHRSLAREPVDGQPTISPVSRKTPNGNVTRSQMKPGPLSKWCTRHHSSKARNGKSATGRSVAPSSP
jgi:hypothetical protein